MKTEKTTKRIYWIATALIVLLDGVMPALTSNTELAVAGIRHLGYPDYFRHMLTFFKVIGAVVLIVPVLKGRLKEWAYAGFSFNFIAAFLSHLSVDGFGSQAFFPLVALCILAVSYVFYQKLQRQANDAALHVKAPPYFASGLQQ